MSTPKKSMIETHGREESSKYQPQLLEQVWGSDNLSKYGTLDIDEYNDRLDNMTRADLETHARAVGVIIVEHTPRLREKLIHEFNSFVSLVQKPENPKSYGKIKITPEAQKVLNEGR